MVFRETMSSRAISGPLNSVLLRTPTLPLWYTRLLGQDGARPLSLARDLKFGIDRTSPSLERLAELLRSCGRSLVEQRALERQTHGKRAWGGFATAIVE